VIFQEKCVKVLKCYTFLWVQRRHNCSPAASFTNCVMTLYLLKVHLQTFLSIPVTQNCNILSCDTLVAYEWYVPDTISICSWKCWLFWSVTPSMLEGGNNPSYMWKMSSSCTSSGLAVLTEGPPTWFWQESARITSLKLPCLLTSSFWHCYSQRFCHISFLVTWPDSWYFSVK